MANSNILKPGDLFFVTQRGLAQMLVPSSPVQKIESYSTGSFAGHPDEKWAIGSISKLSCSDPLMLVREYSWISIRITNTALAETGGGFPVGTYNDLFDYTYTSAALFVALFGDKKVAFAILLKKDQVLEDLIVPWKRQKD